MWPGNIGISATADGYTASSAWGRAPGTFALSLEIESTLAGTVIDAGSGSPIGGARVTLTTEASVMTGYGPSERSDEHGRFRFDRLKAGRYFVIAIGDHRYGRSDGSVLLERGGHVENAIVKVHPAARVEGKILVEGSPPKPCPKAWLTLSYGRPDDELWASADSIDGSVRIDGVTPGSYTANVGCPGHTFSESAFKLDVGDDDVTGLSWKFTKTIGATLRGHVRHSSGLPIAGAHVEAHGDSWGTGTYGSDGSYEINDLAGTVSLNVTSPRGVGPRPPSKVTIPATGVVVKDLSLNAGGSIVGTVTDTEGKAVPDIVVRSDFNGQYPEVRTGRDGAFQFDNVPPGDLTVMVEEPGAPSQRASVTVRSAETARASFVVAARRGRITGTVIDNAGKPIGDAFVTAEREVDESNIAAQVPTSVDGSFTLSPLAAGSYKLTANRAGAGKAVLEHVQIGSKVRIQIKATGSIAGTVRSPDGEITDLSISLDNPKTGVSRRERFYRTDGRYRFEDLPAGTYQLTPRSGESEGQLTVELASGARLTGIDLVFSFGGSLTGRIVDLISKQPVSGIKLAASLTNGQRERVAVSGPDGRFRIEDLAIGPTEFSASGESYASVHLTREVNGANTTLGDIAIVKKRYRRGDVTGRLGITFGNDAFRVVAIDPTGPAAKSGLVVGDVVRSIDGIDVTGVDYELARTLLTVPVGTTIRLGLARGASITIVTVAR